MKYVYILQSLIDPERYYSGSTFDMKRRFDEHNSGKSTHTNKFKPWKLVAYFAFEDHATADRFEQYLKTASGRAFATKRLGYTLKAPEPYKLIIINGQAGTGKSTLARLLKERLPNSACISADAIMAVNPFELTEELYALAFQNLQMLIHNFVASGYRTIIIPGMLSNEQLLTKFLDTLRHQPDLYSVWLRASKEIRNERRIERKRDDADKPEHFDFIDSLIPDVELKIPYGKYRALDTSATTPSDLLAGVLTFLDE